MMPHFNHLNNKHQLTFGQRAADRLTSSMGSWSFIIMFFVFLLIWMILNAYFLIKYTSANAFDPYPFILLNLVLSCLAAIQAPIIMMSQNRQAERDRVKAERDYMVNRKAEREVEDIQKDLEEIKKLIKQI
jgi:uncharacterized membrane protein